MKIVVAPDSFKESMTAAEAAAAMARGVRRVVPEAECIEVPMADGGEGFTDALATALDADLIAVTVVDALGREREAHVALKGDLAVIEGAQAVGLGFIDPARRDIWTSDSRGVGQLILAALDAGARHLVVGLGGSATNDGGAGMLAALGVRFLDERGDELGTSPSELGTVAALDVGGLDPRLSGARIQAACDVSNPLCGPQGASAIFGPQKGATPELVARLDALLSRLAAAPLTSSGSVEADAGSSPDGPAGASVLEPVEAVGPGALAAVAPRDGTPAAVAPRDGTPAAVSPRDGTPAAVSPRDGTPAAVALLPGAGAAGGLGWALMAFLGAEMRPGVALVAETVGLADHVRGADLVLTGEGSVDSQTLSGKTPAGVADAARAAGVPVVILAGRVAPGADVLLDNGIVALVPIVQGVTDLETALAEGPENLEHATATVLRLWMAASRQPAGRS